MKNTYTAISSDRRHEGANRRDAERWARSQSRQLNERVDVYCWTGGKERPAARDIVYTAVNGRCEFRL